MQVQDCKGYSSLDEFTILKTLGTGYNAVVKLGQDKDGKQVAIKRYKSETSDLKTLIDQLNIMKNLNQENIVRLVAVRDKAIYKKKDGSQYNCFAIILEYCSGGELFDFVCDSGKFSQKVTRTYFHQMMSGLHYIHEKGFAHRDIKPENLLLNSEFKLKVADFGFACLLKGKDGSGILHTKLGTEGYMAPQIVQKNYEGKPIDVFSSGVILFIMFAGCPPFEKTNQTDPYFKLLKTKDFDKFWKYHERRRNPGFFPEGFRSLFVNMVAFNPKQRPSIQQIASHPWVKQTLCTHSEIKAEFTKRKQMIEKVLNDRCQQDQTETSKYIKEISGQTVSTDRANKGSQDSSFLEVFNKQVSLKRKLPQMQIQGKDVIETGEKVDFGVSLLKERVQRIQLELFDGQESDKLLQTQPEAVSISFRQFQDSGKTEIVAIFSYKYGTQNLSDLTVEILLSLGLDRNSKLKIKTSRKRGDLVYYRRLLGQIRASFARNIKRK